MKARYALTAMLLGMTAGQAQAMGPGSSIDLSFSDDTAMATYVSPISQSAYGPTNMDIGLLYTESDDLMVSIGMEMIGEAGSQAPGLDFGVSIRAYALTLDAFDDNIGSAALGGKLRYKPEQAGRVIGSVSLNYGPDVTTFGDAERFWDLSARAEFEVLPEAAVFVGYRKTRVKLTRGVDVDLDKGWHLGLRMSF